MKRKGEADARRNERAGRHPRERIRTHAGLRNAKTLARRLDVSYEELAELVRTRFVDAGADEAARPKGIADAFDDARFAAATDARKRELLEILASVDNPNLNAPDTVSCITCHGATAVTQRRLESANADATSIAGRYTSTYDMSVGGRLRERNVNRALGWLGRDAMISQRVVNDTAQLLVELESRFPF
jgi:hypothetical protein